MFMADQMDRKDHPAYDTPEYWQLRERDAGRRQRVREMIAQGHFEKETRSQKKYTG
jgi:hypothetical protein